MDAFAFNSQQIVLMQIETNYEIQLSIYLFGYIKTDFDILA